MAIKFQAKLKRYTNIEKKIKDLGENAFSAADAKLIGQGVYTDVQRNVSAGISPITGKRFPAYKNPKKYPANKKPHSPVNLKLTGEFLDSMFYDVKRGPSGYNAVVGYQGTESEKKEQGHRDGANGQPSRPTLPNENESFSPRIVTKMLITARAILEKKIKKISE